MDTKQISRRIHTKSLVFGLLVIGLGLGWLLHNVGMISENAWDLIFSWQMLLVAIGIINVFGDVHKGWGWILIAIGGFFLLSEAYDWPTTFRNIFWPALLIVIGLFLIFGSRARMWRKDWLPKSDIKTGEDYIEDLSVFGGHDRVIHSASFKGGKVVSVFGGSKIDLTQATVAPEGAVIEIVAVFGGSSILVPADWNVRLEIFNIFGGYGDKRPRAQVDLSKTLVIKGIAVFGGGEIKSY